MVDLWVLQQLSGIGGVVLAALAVLGAAVWLVLVGLSIARWRVPAPFWWLLPVVALCVSSYLGWLSARPATVWLADASTAEIPQIAMAAEAQHIAPRAFAFFLVAIWCVLSSVATATVAVLRLEYPQTTWLSGTLPIASGMTAGTLAVLIALFTDAPLVPILTMITLSGACVTAIALTAFQSSMSRTERTNLNGTRALVLSLGLGALVALGMGWHDILRITAWTSARNPNALGYALTSTVLPSSASFAFAVAAAGLPALATAREGLITLRSAASTAVLALMLAATAGALWLTAPNPIVQEAGRGGAVARIPDGLWTTLPRALDMQEREQLADAIDGSCLISEAPTGWDAEPLFKAVTPAAHVALHVQNPDSVHELDRNPGCPPKRALLDGPLAGSEIAVVALDGSRAAAAITGTEWFREAGSLRILVQPDPRATQQWSSAATRRLASAVPFLWEQPPTATPPEGHQPGTWDEVYAANLPVTLLEGPYPVLLAGGLRSRLPSGELGESTLRLALSAQPSHQRDLVIVPRKHWSVQDVVSYCLAVHGHVGGARCVVRNETPIKWSLRTGLPLPW